MSRSAQRLVGLLAGFILASLVLIVGSTPAHARPNCDVPVPPPICGPSDPPDPVVKQPDLTAAVTGPTAGMGGTNASFTARVANITGTNAAAASGVVVRITASGGAVVTGAAYSGWSCALAAGAATCSGGALGVGASADIPVTILLPSSAASVVVTAVADPSGAIAERNESNNSGGATVTVTAPSLPDLQVTMTGPASVRGLYATGAWTMTITNVGSAPANVVNVRWLTNWGGWINANAVKSGAIGFTCTPPPEYVQQMVYCYGNGVLQPGASATITINAVPPAPTNVYGTAGVSNVTATVDYGQQVAESNEGNNAATVVSSILY